GRALDSSGLAEIRRPGGDELCLQFVRETGETPVVEVDRDRGRLAAAVAGDVFLLAVEIDGVFGVRFEALRQSRLNAGEFRPDAGEDLKRQMRLGGEFKGGTTHAVLIDRNSGRCERRGAGDGG